MRRALLFAVLLTGCAAPDPHAGATPTVRRALDAPGAEWATLASPHAHLHARTGSDAAAGLADTAAAVERAWASTAERLGVDPPTAPIEVFVIESREENRALSGTGGGGTAVPWDRALFLVAGTEHAPPVRHETAHIVSWDAWGTPREQWMSEGAAMVGAGLCAGVDLHDWAAAVVRAGLDAPLRDLARNFDVTQAVAYLQAGSAVQFVAETYGTAAVEALWRGGLAASGRATGLTPDALEAAWRARVRRADASRTPAYVDLTGRVECEPRA